MQDIDTSNITIDAISLPLLAEKDLQVDILRLDKIHPVISGNKWFKLRYHLETAKATNKKTIITFGGTWSNHIIATAAACQLNGLESVGLIRGAMKAYSPPLQEARGFGMKLECLHPGDYDARSIPPGIATDDCYIIPMGGYSYEGADGASTITHYYPKDHYTHICCSAGTGTMAAGLLKASPAPVTIIAISALKGFTDLEHDIRQLTGTVTASLQVIHDYHFGGYAKHTSQLIHFMNSFFTQTGIPTDFVYTAKTCYAVIDMIQQDFFPAGSKILLIHSGGLQGNASFSKGTLIF
jgi:1-aminocyclopropane-1-carboxylate deaminase